MVPFEGLVRCFRSLSVLILPKLRLRDGTCKKAVVASVAPGESLAFDEETEAKRPLYLHQRRATERVENLELVGLGEKKNIELSKI